MTNPFVVSKTYDCRGEGKGKGIVREFGMDTYKLPYLNWTTTRGFPGGSDGKESAYNAADPGLIPGLGRFPGKGNGYPLQSSCLENSMDYIVHGVAKSQTRLNDFGFRHM
ncbi:hypothetical protein B7939_11330 [Eggerthia catenaformis]|nr:hypothetical protein B7939_11330 [Eggerthia catenaformis]